MTEYSALDGMGKIEELVLRAKELGQTFIAITDHGSCSGLWEAQQTCAKHSIKLILGTEFYYQRETDDKNGHLIVLAKNEVGLKNIFKLQEYAYVHNFYKKPRIDFDALIKHKEGIVVTSACLASTICQEILQGNLSSARKWAKKFKDEFGEDFYLEIQPNTIPEQTIVNKELIRIAHDLNIQLVATNDSHYVYESDAYAHEVMLALQVNKKMNDPTRWKFSTNDFWLKSEDEMLKTLLEAGVDEFFAKVALFNTSLIAEKCNVELKRGKYLPPYHSIPHGDSERSLLVKKTVEGVKRTNKTKDKLYLKDVQNEIEIIDRNGYCGYFLIVSDYVTTARSKGVVVGDGRGSGAGSKVAYLTDISRIDPSKYDLLFERFMADGRSPDSIESCNMETYYVKFSERLASGVHQLMC